MKRLIYSLILIITSSVLSNAQNYTISSYTGDDKNYSSSAYPYTYPSESDNLSTWYSLPFAWNFYGQPVTGYRVAHDGYITFENTNGLSIGNNTSLPNSTGPNNAIYACWDNFTMEASLSIQTFGVAPNRIHVIRWFSLNYPGGASFGDDFSVELQIKENCADFDIIIKERNISTNSSFYPMINTTIGCENIDGTIGCQVAGSPNYIPSAPTGSEDYEVYRFSWNGPIVNDASLIGINIGNHLNIGDHKLEGIVRNEGDSALISYDINYTLDGGPVQTTTKIVDTDTLFGGYCEIAINTLLNANEISWHITNSNGTTIAQGNGYSNNNNYNSTYCLPTGYYIFNWNDSLGDGWNGSQYSIINGNGSSIYTFSPNTGFSGSNSFLISANECVLNVTSDITNSKTSYWSHPTLINISSPSENYELKTWVSNVNGQIDDMNCNDTLTEYITGFNNTSANKKVLLEEWTGTWCGYCYDGILVLDNIKDQHGDDVIITAIHNNDSMAGASELLRGVFASSAFPTAVVDRKPYYANNPSNGYANYINSNEALNRSIWPYAVTNQKSDFTPLDININHNWDPVTREIIADIKVDYTDNSAGDVRIVLMIVEDSIIKSGFGWDQSGAPSSPFIHKHVLRNYVNSGPYGIDGIIPHIVSSGDSYQHQFSYTLPNQFDENQVSLVAAVVKYMKGNDNGYVSVISQRYVYNAQKKHLMNFSIPLDIDENKSKLQIYPNPTNGLIYLSESIAYKLYDILGTLVKQGKGKSIDLSTYSNGIYILESKTKRIKIVKE